MPYYITCVKDLLYVYTNDKTKRKRLVKTLVYIIVAVEMISEIHFVRLKGKLNGVASVDPRDLVSRSRAKGEPSPLILGPNRTDSLRYKIKG